MTDYYELLGVPRDAGDEQIKKAYRKLALRYHPDRNDGSKESEERFKEITQAYEVLRDPEKRSVYDRYGAEGLRASAGPGGGFGGFDFSDALNVFMRDFGGFGGFGDLFGGGRGRRGSRRRPGPTVRVRLPVTLQDVVTGVTKKVRINLLEPCEACDGSGAEAGSTPQPCQACQGTGEERVVQRSVFGQLVSVQPCHRCRGEGRVIASPCARCHGEGRTKEKKELTVEVPPGVTSENYITLRGQGSSGARGGPRGDVVVLLEVEEDARFVRDGRTLVHERPVTFAQAALGDRIEVPTLEGTAAVTLPAGTQSGALLRLRGQGLPELQGHDRGDLLVRVVVWTPTRLSPEQEALVRQLRAIEDEAPERIGDEKGGFWSKVKEAFGAG